jgi:hypothetical protein
MVRVSARGKANAARVLAALLSIATCSAACSSSPSRKPAAHDTPGPAPASYPTLVRQAARDAGDQGSVRVATQRIGGSYNYTLEQDLTGDGGHEVIHLGAMRAVEVRFGNHAFLSGNDAAMVGYFGLLRSKQARWHGRWVRISSADVTYSAIRDGFSLPAAIHSVLPVAPLTATTTTLAGSPVIAITGRPAPRQHAPKGARVTLYISKGDLPLPLRASETAPGGITATVTFSRWGEHLNLKPPAHALPRSSLIR